MKRLVMTLGIAITIAIAATAQSEATMYFKSPPAQAWGTLTVYGGSNNTLTQYGFVVDKAFNDFVLTVSNETDTVSSSEKFFSWQQIQQDLNAEHDRTEILKVLKDKVWDISKTTGTREARLRLYALFMEISDGDFQKYARKSSKYCLGLFQMEGTVIVPTIRYEISTTLWRMSIEPAEQVTSGETLFWKDE